MRVAVRLEAEVASTFPPRLVPIGADAAAKLAERSLTKLYNQKPQWLVDAHNELDAAVATAYGWPIDISEEEALSQLLKINQQRSGHGRSSENLKTPDMLSPALIPR